MGANRQVFKQIFGKGSECYQSLGFAFLFNKFIITSPLYNTQYLLNFIKMAFLLLLFMSGGDRKCWLIHLTVHVARDYTVNFRNT